MPRRADRALLAGAGSLFCFGGGDSGGRHGGGAAAPDAYVCVCV